MTRTKLNSKTFHWANLPKLAAVAVLVTGCLATCSLAQQAGQRTFSSAEEAGNALAAAAQNNDEKTMLDILGPEGKRIVSSGDEAEDAEGHANFAKKYQEMHRLVQEPDGSTTLYIGAENWPSPIPLMNNGKLWYFDTEAGEQEILFRRIGRNEMSAIRVCQELVTAQKEYSAQNNEYAQKIFSDEGQHNGLYWKTAADEPKSPVGPLVAAAAADSNRKAEDGPPTSYRGYYYRMLTRQGKGAPGGAKSYLVNGKMTAGFAFEAYPAEYRSSGVMTFIVGEDGAVYQKDLGKKSDVVAKSMKEYTLNSGWQKAQEQEMVAAEKAK